MNSETKMSSTMNSILVTILDDAGVYVPEGVVTLALLKDGKEALTEEIEKLSLLISEVRYLAGILEKEIERKKTTSD